MSFGTGAGKGSLPRHVDGDKFRSNHDRIFAERPMSTYPDTAPESLLCECGRHLPCRHCESDGKGVRCAYRCGERRFFVQNTALKDRLRAYIYDITDYHKNPDAPWPGEAMTVCESAATSDLKIAQRQIRDMVTWSIQVALEPRLRDAYLIHDGKTIVNPNWLPVDQPEVIEDEDLLRYCDEQTRKEKSIEEAEGLRYLSVCSGIEAATTAWHALGWTPAAFSEIEAFPSAVLSHHWPHVPNLGDMTKWREWPEDLLASCDLIVGGTPCQAFSVAGLRKSLDDDRGNLTLIYVQLIDHIDRLRAERGLPPVIVVWENVPGVLSTKDNAFGCFLSAIAGDEQPLEPGPRPEHGKSSLHWRWCKKSGVHRPKWSNAGHITGPARSAAWRTLDAQYFGVAQRRRRVFLVASAREGFCPGEVLFEREGVRRDSPPSREAGERTTSGAQRRSHWSGGAHPSLNRGGVGGIGMSNQEIFSQQGAGLVPDVANPLTARMHKGVNTTMHEGQTMIAHSPRAEGFDASEDGTGRGTPLVPVGVDCFNGSLTGDVAATMGTRGSSETASGPQVMTYAATDYKEGKFESVEQAGPLTTSADRTRSAPVVAFQQNTRDEVRLMGGDGQIAGALPAQPGMKQQNYIAASAVRRLTPVECARLQGFPDHHARIPWRNKPAEDCPDGPQYKAYGNSMAVPCMRFLGERIAKHLE